jgi:PIN domain nuclease of toxin-antitoxin system
VKLKTDQARYVLDCSALIALVHGEPGAETVQAAMGASVVCAVNLTETIAKLIRAGGGPRLVKRYLRGLQLEIMPWDEELAWESRDLCSLAQAGPVRKGDAVGPAAMNPPSCMPPLSHPHHSSRGTAPRVDPPDSLR